ncbi:kinesin-like protein KIF27 isoform X2 [Mastacembelus armatus]|uniref:kinesin-like protein KIF27 isoform X2 n=1 Tax=Mastacembelus armatus TaxID=205130 RepID=UPI000E45D715|nr:kinesin-like protein KIF27 isoform X2 [Mastacembelus armatus]
MSEVCVRVAVRIRPLLPKEVLHSHQVCVRVVPGSAQVMLGSDRVFPFDHAFGPTASQDEVYESCVQPLVESLVHGYNATVFCYGQTGSGKTYTLGGGNLDEDGGIIDRVAQDVFFLLGEKRRNSDGVEATVRVSYMELYREELRDLLELHTMHKELHIREDEKGNTVVVGAKEMVITSAEELLSILETGNALRHTGTTGMNEHSSRSHTILTLQLIQCCQNNNPSLKSVSKLCLVDLAGSERAGKTGNTGTRLKESVHINTGLLALGNVIRALSDPARNRRGNSCSSAHIPYRDAKITRLLRDSLGGTAHTLMVACVSPSHHSVAETLTVLQFASKARHIRNRPGGMSSHTEVKSCPTVWDPGEARLGELEYEVQTLRELLKAKEREMEMERGRAGGKDGEGDDLKQSCQMREIEPEKGVDQEGLSQYRLLAQEAAALLADISGPSPSQFFRQCLQDWQERLTAVNNSHQIYKDGSKVDGDQPNYIIILKLREELKKCQEALDIQEQLLEEKDAELRQVQKEVEKLLQERKTHLHALEEEKQRIRIQTEQLVDQQILVNRLRSDLMTFRGATSGAVLESGASGNSGKRPYSVPLIRHSCGEGPPRKIHSSPPAYSLERVMAAFKMRGHLLLAEIEEKDEVYCPFIKQQGERKDKDQEKEVDDDTVGRNGFRRSLNRTWTNRQKKLVLKEKKMTPDQISNRNPLLWRSEGFTGTKENHTKHSQLRKARLRTSVTQRMIQELSVNMRIKEQLIKELDKTEKETQAVDTHSRHSGDGREGGVLARLSMQSQQIRAEVYRSLQHMRRQRAQLQTNLNQQRQTSDNNIALDKNGEQREGDLTSCKNNHHKESKEELTSSNWLEEEEEQMLQKRAALQELEEELRRREEVLLRREACLHQKNKLELKMLHSSQALSQDLLRVSMRLESVEEQLQSSTTTKWTGGVTTEELEKERDALKKKRDTLDAQLKENRVLNVEEECSLLQLEEAIEALDAALEFKNRCIQDKQKKLLITDSSSHSSENTELCNVIRKLSPPEAAELLIRYFNKVVCLREAERNLRLHYEELELHAGEQEVVLRKMEAAMQRLALDADRRLTEQHRDHQNNIQLLLKKLQGKRVVQDWCSRLFKTDCSIWRKNCFSTKAPVGSSKRNSKSISVVVYTLTISPHTHKTTDNHTICRCTQAQTNPRCILKGYRQGYILQQHTQRYLMSKQTKRMILVQKDRHTKPPVPLHLSSEHTESQKCLNTNRCTPSPRGGVKEGLVSLGKV